MSVGLDELMVSRKVIVLLGAGGVGKTSCAIGMAVAAARLGLRVGLLSIDPAKRLAAALGIPLGHELRPIDLGPEAPLSGSLHAAMLDQKAVFDSMVRRHARSPEVAARILANKLYRAASSKMAGPMEYMALAKLQDMVEAKAYDLVVLDTPPDSQALDFLARPNILAGFMEHKVMSWLVKPFHVASRLGVDRLFSVGGRLMGGLAKVTGFQALRLVTEFLVLMQQVIDGFHSSSQKVLATLKSADTAFVLVTVVQPAALRSAQNLALQLSDLGHPLEAVVFNKCLQEEVRHSLAATFAPSPTGEEKEACRLPTPLPPLLSKLRLRWQLEENLPAAFLEALTADLGRQPLILTVTEREELQRKESIYDFSFAFTASVPQV